MFMADFFSKKRIHRFFDSGKVERLDDQLIGESRLLIRLDGQDFIHAVCTPFQVKEFVIGFLRTRGLIDNLEDIASVDLSENTASVTRTARLRGKTPELRLLESTGSRNVDNNVFFRPDGKIPPQRFSVSAKVLVSGFKKLSDMPLYKKTGGTHCAILFTEKGTPIVGAEDMGRHNAVDKVIGGGMKRAVDFSRSWLAVSGRLPADMVLKPLIVGIPLIASVSAATAAGVEIGERGGITVVGFVRAGQFNCYCHPERITKE